MMPVINVYKSHITRSKFVRQTYYVGGLIVIVYKDGHVWINYNTCKKKNDKEIKSTLNFKKGTKEAEFFRKLVRAK